MNVASRIYALTVIRTNDYVTYPSGFYQHFLTYANVSQVNSSKVSIIIVISNAFIFLGWLIVMSG